MTLPPVSSPDLSSIVDPSSQASASAPAQLACHGNPKPTSGPFLVAPYGGWTEITSFFDHDYPDYAVDGKIVLANGLTATAGDGQASDLFPAYWSPALRQYVNYDGHNGIDYDISYQPVLAAAAGTVSFAGWNESDPYAGYGQMILINHHNGYVTLYGHLSKLEVQQGDRVTAGQEIGISGTTGHSSGPHLHFSVFHNCRVTDPYGWTGPGRDPLRDFNGERATYLWLPGHDPLVLNPPPAWPEYPIGLRLGLPPLPQLGGHALPGLPPVDRLLLLSLPRPDRRHSVSLGLALARTEAVVEREAQALIPFLDDLESQNLIEAYRIIPAAAAVWVRGSVTAAELEGLPSVASLTGVQPRDLVASESGLGHSILVQAARPQSPSLWPVGFRSGLDPSRPVVTVVDNQALIAGFASPGQSVLASLHRGRSVPGVGTAVADAETGGFVDMIHDATGNPLPLQAGDSLQVESGGRVATVVLTGLSVQARSRHVAGKAAALSGIPVEVSGPSGQALWHGEVASEGGAFRLGLSHALPAGAMAGATLVDAGGDQESATGFVPGIVASEHTSLVQGWAVGHSPLLRVYRRGRLLATARVAPNLDGSFSLELTRARHALILLPGDLLVVGSRWHQHPLKLPDLGLQLSSGSTRVIVHAPAGSRLDVTFDGARGTKTSLSDLTVSRRPLALAWPMGRLVPGDAVTVRAAQPTGDAVELSSSVRQATVHEGDDLVTGTVKPGTTVSIQVETTSHRLLGQAVAASDPESGRFVALVHDPNGFPRAIEAGSRVSLTGAGGRTAIVVPALAVTVQKTSGSTLVRAAAGERVVVTGYVGARKADSYQLTAGPTGYAAAGFGTRVLSGLSEISALTPGADGWSIERSMALSGRPPVGNRGAAASVKRAGRR
jgi:murein DD-endopeptidase MepM/ murein hydrolase activator NlpD